MGWPEGTVRALISMFLIGISLLGGLVLLSTSKIDFNQFLAISNLPSVVVGYYFGKRD